MYRLDAETLPKENYKNLSVFLAHIACYITLDKCCKLHQKRNR